MGRLNLRLGSSLAFVLVSCVSSPPDDDGGAGVAGAGARGDGGAGEAGAGAHAGDGGAGVAGARDGGEGGVASGRGGSGGTIEPGGAPNASGGTAEGGTSGVDGGSGASNEGGAPANGGADAAGGATGGDAGETSAEGGASYGGSPAGNGGADEGGASSGSAGASGGVPSGQGGGGHGGSPAGNAGDTASGGAPQGGGGGTGEQCVVDLLPADAFRTALWSEFTNCEEFLNPYGCPTEFPPIIYDGAAHFNFERRQAGTAWYLSVSTLVTIPPDAIYATLDWSVEISGEGPGSPRYGALLDGQSLYFSLDVTQLAGQSVPLEIYFSEISGVPHVATVRDVTLQVQRCWE